MPTLEWANREGAVRAATRAPFRLLEHDPALSCGDPDNENMLIQGDNLEGVKRLRPALGFVTLRRDSNTF